MEEYFLYWLDENVDKLKSEGIVIDELVKNDGNYSDLCTRVDLLSKRKISRIVVFHSGRTYMEILDIETTNTEFIFDNFLKSNNEIEKFLTQNIFKIVCSQSCSLD
jgi:hypothetical protein